MRYLFLAFLASAMHLRALEVLSVPPAASTMPPALAVIVQLSLQYFVVYMLLELSVVRQQLTNPTGPKSIYVRCFEEAAQTVDLAPMLGVLFLALRMRAQQLWPPNGNVPTFTQSWMWFIDAGILIGAAAAALEKYLGAVLGPKTGKVASIFSVAKIVATVLIYAGMVVVVAAIFELPAMPGSPSCTTCTWAYQPPISPAVQCVINLTMQYFAIYLAILLVKVYNQVLHKGRKTFAVKALEDSLVSVKLCPMLALMFVGVRMRALQMNLANPPAWAQLFFFITTYAALSQTILALLISAASGESAAALDDDGTVKSRGRSAGAVAYLLTVLKYCAMAVMIVGVGVTGYSLFAMKAPYGETPPVSTTMLCVINLITQYLVLAILSTLAQSYSQLVLGGAKTDAGLVLEKAMPTLAFIPMLSVLFVAVRMRALQLNSEGAPQPYVQKWMEISTWAVLAQTIAALMLPFCTGELAVYVEVPYLPKALVLVKYIATGAMFFGVLTCIFGIANL